MKRMAMLILALMLTVLPVAALGEGESTVTVYGYGKTYVTLDTAVITFEISASAKTVQEARKQHDQKLEELYTTLESVGISKNQLQMSDSFLNTQYEFKFGKLERGVEQDEQSVGSEWKLTLPEKGMLEGTLDAILSANVVSGYTFTLESSAGSGYGLRPAEGRIRRQNQRHEAGSTAQPEGRRTRFRAHHSFRD